MATTASNNHPAPEVENDRKKKMTTKEVTQRDLDNFPYLANHINDIIIDPRKADNGAVYCDIAYDKATCGKRSHQKLAFYAVPMATYGNAKLTGVGNLGEEFHESEDKALFTFSTAPFYVPPYVNNIIEVPDPNDPKKTIRKPRVEKWNEKAFIDNHIRFIKTMRALDKHVWRLLWDVPSFDGIAKKNFSKQKRCERANAVLKKEHKQRVKDGDDESELKLLKPEDETEVAAVLDANPEEATKASDMAYQAWYENPEEKYKHILPWPEKKDTDVANPRYMKSFKNKKNNNTVETKEVTMSLPYDCPVYKKKVAATAKEYPKELQRNMLTRRHPDCEKRDAALEVEEKDTSPGAKEGAKKKVTYQFLYNQLWILTGGTFKTLEYSPDDTTQPILPGSIVMPFIEPKVVDSPLAVGVQIKHIEKVYRCNQGESSIRVVQPDLPDYMAVEETDEHGRPIYNVAVEPNGAGPSESDGGPLLDNGEGQTEGYPSSPQS